MKYDALLVIDMQIAMMDDHPYNETAVTAGIQRLIRMCRERETPVIFIQHDGGPGDVLEHGSTGWQIIDEVSPLPGETLFEKQYNSAFRNTKLREHLTQLGAKSIIICGMQTEYCVDATCKVAFEYGFDVTIVSGTTTTYDCDFAGGAQLVGFYETNIWNGNFARVIPMEQIEQ